jgi:hypothetical protein
VASSSSSCFLRFFIQRATRNGFDRSSTAFFVCRRKRRRSSSQHWPGTWSYSRSFFEPSR